ncbi:MAG: sugar ABC transporter substrate-binding protein [Treponema sp.]|nr:sugar ABC transporter substrate-binding protein [Treponema sp.]
MKNLRIIAVAVLLVCFLVFLPSCQRRPSVDRYGRINLYWAMWDYRLTVYYTAIIEAYQEKNPGVRIVPVDLGSADFSTVLMTQLAGGANLDILTIKDIPGYANLIRQNRLLPLNSFIEEENIDIELYGGIVEQLMVDGEVFALPFRSDFWLVFFNKDIFDAAGVPYPTNDMTLDEFEALARLVTSGSGASRIFGAHYHTWRSTVQLFGILDGMHTMVDGNYDFLRPHYERVLRKQDDGIVMPYALLRTSGIHYSGVFFNGQVAMMNMGTWFIGMQMERVALGQAERSRNWGMVKYPRPEGVPAGTTLGTITGIGVNRNSRHREEALDFVRFVSGLEGALILAQTGTIPALLNDEVIDKIASMPGFPPDVNSREALNVYRTFLEMPLHERSAEIEIILNEAHDAIMTRNISVENGIRQMNERVGRILAR